MYGNILIWKKFDHDMNKSGKMGGLDGEINRLDRKMVRLDLEMD